MQVTRLLILLSVTGGFINAVQTTMFALAAHVYPTASRATGVGAALSVGRTGAIFSGYAGPWALEHRGTSSFFMLMTAAMVASSVALALVRRHVPRR
jgi:AAHS family 4-hydroxybenzoate transporter-like MFS transporter